MNVDQEIANINRQLNKLKLGVANPQIPLPKYKGRLDERDFPEFIKEFNKCGNVMGFDEAKCCRILPYCLENDAWAAYESIDDNVTKTNWQLLVDRLAQMLARSNDLGFQRRKLMELKQGNESPLEFGIKIRELVARAYPQTNGYNAVQRDQMATDYFINGLREDLQTQVMRRNPPDLSEAIKMANQELNIIQRITNANKQSKDIEQLNEEIKKLNNKIDINYIERQNPSRGFNRFKPFNRFWKKRSNNYGQNNNYRPNNNNNYQSSSNVRPNSNNYRPKNNYNRPNANNFRPNFNQNNSHNGPKRNEYKGKKKGGYSINAATVSETLFPTLMLIMAIFIIAVNGQNDKSYKICPQPRVGYLIEWPQTQQCEMNLNDEEKVEQINIEIFVPRTAPTMIPAFKCLKLITQYCFKRIFWVQVDDWKRELNESVSAEDCWQMANTGTILNGTKLIQKNEDLWETEKETISPPYMFWNTECVNATVYKLQIGTVGSIDGQSLVSTLEEMSKCNPTVGNCKFEEATIVWPFPNSTTFCTYASAGKFQALKYTDYILIEEITAAFIKAEGNISEPEAKCVPKGSILMENDVIIQIEKEKKVVKRDITTTTKRAWRTPPPPRTSSRKTPAPSASIIQLNSTTKRPSTTTTTWPTSTTRRTTTAIITTNRIITSTIRQVTYNTNTITQTSTKSPIQNDNNINNINNMANNMNVNTQNNLHTPIEAIKNEQVFKEYFTLMEQRLKEWQSNTNKFIENKIKNETRAIKTRELTYMQENNNLNTKLQYMAAKNNDEMKFNFKKLWSEICRLHNFQINIIKTIIRLNPKEGVQLWLNRNDITAIHNGEALLIAPCTIVTPGKIYWSHTLGKTCFQYTPVRVHNMTLFIIPGTDELSLHSPNISCSDKPVPAFKDSNGQWKTDMGIAQVSNANKDLVFQSKQKLIKFRAASIFNSDLHRIATSVTMLEAYTKRINEKLANIPKATHFTDTSQFVDNFGAFASDAVETLINVGKEVANKTNEFVEKGKSGILNSILSFIPAEYKLAILIGLCVIVFGAIIVGLVYTYPFWAPIWQIVWDCRPKSNKSKAITVAAVSPTAPRESFESIPMLTYVPKIYSVSWNRGKHAYIRVKLNGKGVRTLIDPGSEISYCRASIARLIDLKIDLNDTPQGSAANNTPINFIGSAMVKIKFGEYTVDYPILVSEDKDCPAPFLLGSDFTDDIRLNFNDKQVEFKGQNVPMIANLDLEIEKEYKVHTDKDIILEPRSDNAIIAYIDDRFSPETNFIVTDANKKYDNLVIGKSIVSPGSSQQVAIRLLNAGKTPIKIYAGSNIARLEPLDNKFEPKPIFRINNAVVKGELPQSKRKNKDEENWEKFFPDMNYPAAEGNKLEELNLEDCSLSSKARNELIKIINRNKNAFTHNGKIGTYKGPIMHSVMTRICMFLGREDVYSVGDKMHNIDGIHSNITDCVPTKFSFLSHSL